MIMNQEYIRESEMIIQRYLLWNIENTNLYAYVNNNPVNRRYPFGLYDPTAMRDQQMALCGGRIGCQPDMTPRNPQEALFQDVISGGLNSMVTATIAVPMVSAYGPAVMTALRPIVATMAGEVVVYGTTAVIGAKTLVTYLTYQYLQHPELYNQVAKGIGTGLLKIMTNQQTGLAPSSSDVTSYWVDFAITRSVDVYDVIKQNIEDQYIQPLNSRYQDDLNRSNASLLHDCSPKKGCE